MFVALGSLEVEGKGFSPFASQAKKTQLPSLPNMLPNSVGLLLPPSAGAMRGDDGSFTGRGQAVGNYNFSDLKIVKDGWSWFIVGKEGTELEVVLV